MRSSKIKNLTHAALIAALYAALTVLLAPISYGGVQLRVSEALTILPMFTPAAVPGLTLGCLLANLWGSANALDIVFGTLATLVAALGTRMLRKKPLLAALCPVAANGLIVGAVLSWAYRLPLFLTMGTVALGELIACVALGLPLRAALKKSRLFRKK